MDGKTLSQHIGLLSVARRLHRLSEAECNGIMLGNDWEESEKLYERREARLMREAEKILKDTGWKAYRQGDPRGCSLYLYRPEDALRFHGHFPCSRCATDDERVRCALDGGYSSFGVAVHRLRQAKR